MASLPAPTSDMGLASEEQFNIRREIVLMKDWYRSPPAYLTDEQAGAVLYALSALLCMARDAEKGAEWKRWRLGTESSFEVSAHG